MLSIQQALEIKESIKSYLTTTFSFRERNVAKGFEDFIEHPTGGMFKGPYLSLKLRFVKANQQAIEAIPLMIKPSWSPYDHQVKSWERLSTIGKIPEPTIVTTGTGSGKTESFLFPILDYCHHYQYRKGIKVIILYPMNALATDQAKRLAEIIYNDPRLKDKITAGLFVGEGRGPKGQKPKIMGETNIIENNDYILDAPPDILLTNFKMLDYALMKNNYHKLWNHNLKDTTLLKFLVLDELHTYDGAQGTDVANLIRRLKLKLKLPAGQLCPVGTSATIGSGPEAAVNLAKYATKVFGEEITESAIITENRISPDEFFLEDDKLSTFLPELPVLEALQYDEERGYDWFINKTIDAWQLNKTSLAPGLMGLKIVKDLVIVINKTTSIKTIKDIIRDLTTANEAFRNLPEQVSGSGSVFDPRQRVIESLCTLISEAKDIDNPRSPFMYLQVQLWIRELSGVQMQMGSEPVFTFRDQVDADEEVVALPPWYCRECNSAGWLGVKRENSDTFSKDVHEIYEKYFSKNKNVYYLLRADSLSPDNIQISGYQPTDANFNLILDPKYLSPAIETQQGAAVQSFRKVNDNKMEPTCPCCNGSDTISIIGTKVPTLSSIAVSQTLATDLDATDEKGRKILAFTNSVQDAAHQAGFVESRNYRFALRTAVQKIINQLDEPIRLNELVDKFLAYWKEHGDESGKAPLDGYLYRFFPKDYLGKLSPKNFIQNGHYSQQFLREFDLRVRWEIYCEFGYNARVGRTLEKTGASAAYFDAEKLEQGWEVMQPWLASNDTSQEINKDTFITFSNLVLHRLKNRGGIDHAFLSKYRQKDYNIWDLNWQRDDRHFLNQRFAERTRFPKILTTGSSQNTKLDTTRTSTNNWYHAFFKKSFTTGAFLTTDFINDFYLEWTRALTQAGILNHQTAKDQDNYAINPAVIWVNKDTNQYTCDTCEDTQFSNGPVNLVQQGACLSYRCTGHYNASPQNESNYYKEVYNRNRSPRVFAKEHTGLLERDAREALEYDFKNREKPNSVNALIATSTLEMGIDIGNLNTTYNNSIPPLPSNFLQRVGRAGRSSGSATVVNFAKNQNHDLYYFTDPLAMMNGEVSTPGCYLEAKDILKRHFTAFCVDSWTSENPSDNTIPGQIRLLKLTHTSLIDPSFFVNRFNKFIETHKSELISSFLSQYDTNIQYNIFPEIEQSLNTGTFYDSLIKVFERLKIDLQKLDDRRKDINQQKRTLNLAKGDPLFEDLKKEQKNINGLKSTIYNKNILEHLTNCGILPNYAFPETGVTLNARLHSGSNVKQESISQDKTFEIVRPAVSALKELAPENYFYTQGYRFQISGVNTFNWGDRAIKHTKRFCSKCDHLADDASASAGNCPKCGDPSWSSSANTHTYVQMTGVGSFSNRGKAALDDRSDDRERYPYQMMSHVLLDKASSEGAWVLKDIPFGIEYVKNIRILTANYGRSDSSDSNKININEIEILRKGFVTCKTCGKSVSSTQLYNDASDYHYGFCRHRDIVYDSKHLRTDVFEEIFLFKEMQTEALKIVLPIQDFETETDISLFQSGLELGFKKYFKGNPSHIHILPYKEYNQKTDKTDRFLLVYDTIPGGTGYLKELFSPESFSQLLRLGYEAIKNCECQLNGHDGCYKCIYSYHNQYNREDLSRAKAEKWFEKIVQKAGQWDQTNAGLTSITNTGKIEESELEERFIKYIAKYAEKLKGYTFSAVKEEGVVSYKLVIDSEDIKAIYWIKPQVVLGPKDNIQFNTRTDFMISCAKYKCNGQDYHSEIKKIAIYLDGYQFHASEQHNNFEKDIQLRSAIIKNEQYRTWTLTWDDLNYFEKQLKGDNSLAIDPLAAYIHTHVSPNFQKLLPQIKDLQQARIPYASAINNVDRLFFQLIHPPIAPNKTAWFYFLGSWSKSFLNVSYDPTQLKQVYKKQDIPNSYIKTNAKKDLNGLIPVNQPENKLIIDWDILVNIGTKQVYQHLIINNLQAIDKEDWQFFWNIFNLFQTPHIYEYNKEEEALELEDDNWSEELFENYADYLHPIIAQAIEKNIITVDNKDFIDSYLDKNGHVLADGELILQDIKVAINPSTPESKKILEENGFKIYNNDDLDNIDL
ncbi:DEAD/DEAH box helicase [Arachidicoccus ginsenosidivorans]|uniref:DEAD/DEAH box helicase n=1 Tax=Arachidicoccus ginsenosidivorans TaxID=496057 RepID=A0A5B8VR38_9BACT|nr:DEAD/DEAH box helicase [Arachidicoccus ginsenosidivorans]QEC73065.1 DEAD/DEAH box helicase [Arachidicoccus ginsenosidivorans]